MHLIMNARAGINISPTGAASARAENEADTGRVGDCATSNFTRSGGELEAKTRSKSAINSKLAEMKDATSGNRHSLTLENNALFKSFLRIAGKVFAVFVIKGGFKKSHTKAGIARSGGLALKGDAGALIPADSVIVGFAEIRVAGEADWIEIKIASRYGHEHAFVTETSARGRVVDISIGESILVNLVVGIDGAVWEETFHLFLRVNWVT